MLSFPIIRRLIAIIRWRSKQALILTYSYIFKAYLSFCNNSVKSVYALLLSAANRSLLYSYRSSLLALLLNTDTA
jgi:hypothetical protein